MSETNQSAASNHLLARIAELEDQLATASTDRRVSEGTEAQLRETLGYTESIVDTVREPMLVLNNNLRVTNASRSF